MAKYRVLSGIDYPPNKRAEIGDVVDDLPADSIKWLLESNIIEPADKASSKAQVEEPVAEEPIVEEPVAQIEPEPVIADEPASSDEQVEAGE